MAVKFDIQAATRTEHGKSHSRRMRRLHDNIPAVIYGAGKDPQSITLDHKQINLALKNESFYSHILNIHIDGKVEKAILRGVQRHPVKPKIMHIDFLRISATEKLKMHVPLHFKNEDIAPGVKDKNGLVSHLQTSIEISCLPDHLPEYIEVDLANLDIDEAIHLSQLKLPEGVECVELSHGHHNDLAVVSIHVPRVAEEETPTPETEIITEKKSEDEASPAPEAATKK